MSDKTDEGTPAACISPPETVPAKTETFTNMLRVLSGEERIALALERIAAALERSSMPYPTGNTAGAQPWGQQPQPWGQQQRVCWHGSARGQYCYQCGTVVQ